MEVAYPQTPRQLTYSKTACSACRSQKIRCSREKPSCNRCTRRHFSCTYPDPVNRRLTSISRSRQFYNSNNRICGPLPDTLETRLGESSSNGSTFLIASPTRDFHRIILDREIDFTEDLETAEGPRALRSKLPELEIGLLLIEVYFSRVWTAALLFDHRSFIEDYRAGKVPEHVLRSIFSVASLFFRAPPPGSCGKENGLAAFASIHELGRGWAETGSQLVLMRADVPSVSNIQACEVLSLYWFAVGQLDRNAIHFSISRESCRILQQKADRMEAHGLGFASDYFKMPQRLRWACSIKRCIMETETHLMEPITSERSDISGSSTPQLLQRNVPDWLTWEETNLQSSASYVVKLFKLWKIIKSFVVQTSSYTNASAFLAAFFDLDSNLQQFYSTLPPQFKSPISIHAFAPEPLQRNVFFVHSIYYLCIMCLHSSAVPALSCSKTGFSVSHEIVKLSAGMVYSNARRFVEMSREFLSTTPDFTKVPSFVGYCAFVAGSVQECVLEFQDIGDGHDLPDDVEICMIVLRELTVYWPILNCFERDLQRRFQRLNPDFHTPSKITVQKLLDSPRPLSFNESDPPALTALINASQNITSNSGTSFILRQYNNPNANRQDEGEIESNDLDPENEAPAQDSSVRTQESSCVPLDLSIPNDTTLSPTIESLPADASEFLDIPLPDHVASSPYNDYNFTRARSSASPLNGKLSNLDTQNENIWGLWDLFPDNLGELFSGQPVE